MVIPALKAPRAHLDLKVPKEIRATPDLQAHKAPKGLKVQQGLKDLPGGALEMSSSS
jgi:hypothetical protein